IERGRAANTLAAYGRDLAGYVEYLQARDIHDLSAVTPAMVSDFAQQLRTKDGSRRSAASVARTLSSVRGLHRFCLEEGHVETDATADTKPPKLALRLPKAIPLADVEALLEAAGGDDPVSLRDRALLEVLYAT